MNIELTMEQIISELYKKMEGRLIILDLILVGVWYEVKGWDEF